MDIFGKIVYVYYRASYSVNCMYYFNTRNENKI